MAEDEEDWIHGSVAMSRTSHLFTMLNVPSEFDEEDVECRIGTTVYAVTRSSTAPARIPDEIPVFFPGVSVNTLSPLLWESRTHDPLLFKCLTTMRLITGEPPETEAKSWRRKRHHALESVTDIPSSVNDGDIASFLESALGEATLHGSLCAVLFLLQFPSSRIVKPGPNLGKLLNVPSPFTSDAVTGDLISARILKRCCDAASEYVAKRCSGTEKTAMPPPAIGVKSQHPMTYIYFTALMGAFVRRMSSRISLDLSGDLSDVIMFAARILALNLWHLEASTDANASTAGLGRTFDAGEPPHRTLAAQSNAQETVFQLRDRLLSLITQLRGANEANPLRNGLEECSFAWGAGLMFFYPRVEDKLTLLTRLVQQPNAPGDGTHMLLENLCARLSFQPDLCKSIPFNPTMDLLIESIHKHSLVSWEPQRTALNSSALKIIPVQHGEQPAPNSPASSTGGASVYSVLSRKRGDEDDDEEETIDESGSVSGHTKARSVGTSSIASSLIAVAEEGATGFQEHFDLEQVPAIVGGDGPRTHPPRVLQQQASKSSIKSVTLDPSPLTLEPSAQANIGSGPEVVRPPFVRYSNRVRLLWILQSMCMVKFHPSALQGLQQQGAQPGQGPLAFDEARCAETIQVSVDGRKASQKADKKWGTAITSCGMNASISDVFKWRVRVDRCEDGHVFFGVASRDASSSTYLGEDANGWGFIGRGHLWHNREKRGSYGEAIRTGEVVTVTLDCKRGTLSFATTHNDFGVAFKGLRDHCSGDAFLYPAVALYEKGDAVTILPALSPGDDVNSLEKGIAGGMLWSHMDSPIALEKCLSMANRSFNSLVVPPPENFIVHLETILARLPTLQSMEHSMHLLSVLSGFCLWPNHCISSRLSLRLLPKAMAALTWCVALCSAAAQKPLCSSTDLSGKWWFHDSSSTKHQVDLTHIASTGAIRGVLQSKREGAVKIMGSTKGQHIVLLEQWKSSSRYVKMRLMMPSYRVALGVHQSASSSSSSSSHSVKPMIAIKAAPSSSQSGSDRSLQMMLVICSLIGKLCFALTGDSASSEEIGVNGTAIITSSERKWAASELFVHQKSEQSSSILLQRLDECSPLRELVFAHQNRDSSTSAAIGSDDDGGSCQEMALEDPLQLDQHQQQVKLTDDDTLSQSSGTAVAEEHEFLQRFVEGECEELDHWMLRFAGQAALVAKGGPIMALVRRNAIASLLVHSGVLTEARLIDKFFAVRPFSSSTTSSPSTLQQSASPVEESVDEELDSRREGAPHPSVMLINVWRAATRIVSWAIREKQTQNVSYEMVCEPLLSKARLLLSTRPVQSTFPRLEYDGILASSSAPIAVNKPSDHALVLMQMDAWKRQARAKTLRATKTHADSMETLVNFYIDRQVDASRLQQIFAERAWRAMLRCAGFNATARAAQILISTTRPSVLFPGAIAAIIQWLPGSNFGGIVGPLDAEPAPQMEELYQNIPPVQNRMPVASVLDFEDMELAPAASTSPFRLGDRSDCLYGLDGCGSYASKLVRGSFENLYAALGDALVPEATAHSGGSGTQQIGGSSMNDSWSNEPGNGLLTDEEDLTAMLNLWGFPLRSTEDFEFLERVDLIPKVKRVLDRWQSASKAEFVEFESTAAEIPMALRLSLKQTSTVSNSCLRLLATLAHQIVSDSALQSASSSKDRLCSLIFSIAFQELSSICDALKEGSDKPLSSSASQPSVEIFDEEYCFQLLQLLFSVSVTGTPKLVQTYLCSSLEWVNLLLNVSRSSRSVRIQQRSLRLLARLVPSCPVVQASNPSGLVDNLFAMIKDTFPLSPRSSSSSSFLASTVGRSTPAAECVRALRKLLEAPEWQPLVTEALRNHLDEGSQSDQTSNQDEIWAALSVLGGFYDPLRVLGLVRFTPAATQEFEAVLANSKLSRLGSLASAQSGTTTPQTMVGVIVGLHDNKCQVAIPGISSSVPGGSGEDADGAGEDGTSPLGSLAGGAAQLRMMSKGNKTMNGSAIMTRAMAAVLCERSDVVPIASSESTEAVVSMLHQCSDIEQKLSWLFDSYVLSAPSSSDAAVEDTEDVDTRVSRSIVRASLARMAPMLLANEKVLLSNPDLFIRTAKLATRPTETVGIHDLHLVIGWWRSLTDVWCDRRSTGNNTASGSSGNNPGGVGGDNVPTRPGSSASGGLPEEPMSPALTEMLSLDLGFPKEMCALALDRCGNDVEQAIHYCLEHAKDMESLIEEYRWSRTNRTTTTSATASSGGSAVSSQVSAEQRRSAIVIEKLKEMGFPHTWCVKAVEAVHHEGFNPALTWILANGDLLQEQDEAAERALAAAASQQSLSTSSDDSTDVKKTEAEKKKKVVRLVCTSGGQMTTQLTPDGHVSVRPVNSGLGGFPSVTAKGLLLTTGRWYYEVTLETENCMQIGWADACFTGDVFEGNGVGDDAHSWAFDGYRRFKWHVQSAPWGKQWKIGDCIGCAVDVDSGEIWFSLNGNWEDGMGLAFKGLLKNKNFVGGLVPAASFNRTERMRFNFGPEFKYPVGPPSWMVEGKATARAVVEAFDDEECNAKLKHSNRLFSKWKASDEEEERGLDVIQKRFEDVDDCLEESIGDALSDRYFSLGQFASTSLLARRSSSGASGPSVGSGGGLSSSSAPGSNPFQVKDPFPRACALTASPTNGSQAMEELLTVERSAAGDERIAKALEQACDCLVTLFARVATLNVMLSLHSGEKDSSSSTKRMNVLRAIISGLGGVEEGPKTFWRLFRTCSSKLKVADLKNAVISVFDHGVDASLWTGKEDVLGVLTQSARDIVAESKELRAVLFESLTEELSNATQRAYASIPWDDAEIANPLVVHSIWQVAMDDTSLPYNEVKLLEHPSVRFACWATELLRMPPTELVDSLRENRKLVYVWALSLRSPGTRMKIVATRMIFSFVMDDPESDSTLRNLVHEVVDTRRIRDVAERLLSRSGTVSLHSVLSKYSSAMAEMAATVCTFEDDEEVILERMGG